MVNFLTKIFGSRNDRLIRQYRRKVAVINKLEPEMKALPSFTVYDCIKSLEAPCSGASPILRFPRRGSYNFQPR